ncbi:MAG TPA: hypothetical protein VIS99_09265 [Terrimicrobiaceae bacterium]
MKDAVDFFETRDHSDIKLAREELHKTQPDSALFESHTIDASIEGEVEVVQRADLAEVGGFLAPGDCALLSHVEFVLENEFQELGVGEPVGFGFLEAQLEGAKQSRETQAERIFFEDVVGHS